MAAPGRHVGHLFQRNSRFLLNNFEHLWGNRTFGSTSLQRQAAEATKEATETFVIPRKKTWNKEAVLEALAATVSRDPTAYPYQFQDDPYLSPRTYAEFTLFSLSKESGKAAAKYFVNNNPKFFTEDFAEPHIPCLMPETVSLRLEETSEDALKERINLRKVKAAVDMFDELLQAGTVVSLETTHDLLDLICVYCDRDPVEETEQQPEDAEVVEEAKRKKGRAHRASEILKPRWKENNNAERIFNLLPERDTRCYSALIRGMVMHGAYEKAFNMFRDMLNNRLTADVHIFNTLISAAPEAKEKYHERWEVITELLNLMSQQKVKPNLLTFNSVLKALRRCGSMAKAHSLHTLNEMKHMGIAPSLATYDHILAIFSKAARQGHAEILQEVMSEVEGTSFTCQDPDDVVFFKNAVILCAETKDLEMAFKVQELTEVKENWRLMGDLQQRSIYYGRFFSLVCSLANLDVALKWYRRLVPSLYYPTQQSLKDLLQALDTDSRMDLLPTIWADIRTLGHHNKSDLLEELLSLMARDTHSPEVQESFAVCALDITNVFEGDRGKNSPQWSASSLTHVTSLLLRAGKTKQAWEMLQLFKSNNRVPAEGLLKEFLSVCCTEKSPQMAVELVQFASNFCLSATPTLAKQALTEFELTEEQRSILTELESAGETSE